MEAKDHQFFKDMLKGMLDDTLKKSEETIEDMNESGEVYADPADRATEIGRASCRERVFRAG